MEDSEILALFLERSEQAIVELDRKYGAAVHRIASNILRSGPDAEECRSDAYLGVWNSIPPQRPEHLGGYVCRLARNLAVSRLRTEKAQKRGDGLELVLEELSELLPSRENVEAELEARELAEAIERFLSTLSYDDRFLFVRRYWYADSVRDIAAAMHRTPERLSLRLFRLRERLKKQLQKEGLLV